MSGYSARGRPWSRPMTTRYASTAALRRAGWLVHRPRRRRALRQLPDKRNVPPGRRRAAAPGSRCGDDRSRPRAARPPATSATRSRHTSRLSGRRGEAGAEVVMLVVPEFHDNDADLERYFLTIAEQVDSAARPLRVPRTPILSSGDCAGGEAGAYRALCCLQGNERGSGEDDVVAGDAGHAACAAPGEHAVFARCHAGGGAGHYEHCGDVGP